MKSGFQATIAMSSARGLTKLMAAIGDPIGRLETAPDLAEFSTELREKSVQKSRIGVLLTADYAVSYTHLTLPTIYSV